MGPREELPVWQKPAASVFPTVVAVCYILFAFLFVTGSELAARIGGHHEELPFIRAIGLFWVVVAIAILWLRKALKKALPEGSSKALLLLSLWIYGLMVAPIIQVVLTPIFR